VTDASLDGATRSADEPSGYEIVILLSRGEGRDVASTGEADDIVSLPRVALVDEPETPAIIAAIAGILGGDPPPLLRIVPLTGHRVRPGVALVELEPLVGRGGPQPRLPERLAWRALTSASAASAEPALARPYLERWLSELDGSAEGPPRPPWSRPGWQARASAWMTERLADVGSPLVAAPQLHALWGLSAVIRGETADGAFFLKACSPVFPTEPAITRVLAASEPDLLPNVVAVDEAENWLLMGDIGKSFVGDAPVARWPDGLAAQGAIQRRWLGRTDELAAAGFERRGLAELASQIPRLPELSLLAPLKPESMSRLEAAIPRLLEACERLSAIGPDDTIVHGDLHPWNVADVDGRSIVFDWSDSCIGHPFLDLATYVCRTADVVARQACVDAYSAAWSDVLQPAELEEAVLLALPLGALHQVESYRRIVAGVAADDVGDMAEAGPHYAEQALAWLDNGLAAEFPVHD
jgi:Phosphotransferase enzyme family